MRLGLVQQCSRQLCGGVSFRKGTVCCGGGGVETCKGWLHVCHGNQIRCFLYLDTMPNSCSELQTPIFVYGQTTRICAHLRSLKVEQLHASAHTLLLPIFCCCFLLLRPIFGCCFVLLRPTFRCCFSRHPRLRLVRVGHNPTSVSGASSHKRLERNALTSFIIYGCFVLLRC